MVLPAVSENMQDLGGCSFSHVLFKYRVRHLKEMSEKKTFKLKEQVFDPTKCHVLLASVQ